VAATVAVTWLIVSQVGVTFEDAMSVGDVAPDLSVGLFVLSVLALLAAFLFAARLWGRMVAELGASDPGFVVSARIFLASNLGRYLPGKVWQMAGLAVLARRVGVPGSVAAAAGVLGQMFALIAAGVFALPIVFDAVGPGRAGPVMIGAIVAAVIVGASSPRVLEGALGFLFRAARVPQDVAPRIGKLFGPRWVALYLVSWTVYGAAFHLFVRSLGIEAGPVVTVASFAGAYLLGYLAFFAPAGIGVREGFLIAFLRPDLGAAALGVAVLARVWMTAVELLPAGGLALWEIVRRDTPGHGPGGTAPTRVGPVPSAEDHERRP
jgi:hypothetical protein